MLCEGKCEDQALKLSSLAMNLNSKEYFEEQDYEFIRDIYYACLERTKKKKELLGHVCFSHI